MFAGLMPLEIENLYPEYWSYDEEEGFKNLFEEKLLQNQINRLGKNIKFYYQKILNTKEGQNFIRFVGLIFVGLNLLNSVLSRLYFLWQKRLLEKILMFITLMISMDFCVLFCRR